MQYKRAILSGLCLGSVLRGIKNGFPDFTLASRAAAQAVIETPSPLKNSIPVKTLTDLLGTKQIDILVTVKAYENGQLPLGEAISLLSLLVFVRPKTILEIGTFNGITTKAMAMNLPEANIHTVDLPIDYSPSNDNESITKDDFHLIAARKVGQAFLGTSYASRITQHFGDTASWNFAQAEGATFFFIDGSHTYEYCRNDSEKCFELCRGKGIFLWHDCDDFHPGVLRFISEWRSLGRDIVRIENTPLCYWSSI